MKYTVIARFPLQFIFHLRWEWFCPFFVLQKQKHIQLVANFLFLQFYAAKIVH
jgi:hypothetical protein